MSRPGVEQDAADPTAGDDADSSASPKRSSRLRSTLRQVLTLAQHAGDDRVPF